MCLWRSLFEFWDKFVLARAARKRLRLCSNLYRIFLEEENHRAFVDSYDG
jgi:hypothetical protein